jgi:hypothetical protein
MLTVQYVYNSSDYSVTCIQNTLLELDVATSISEVVTWYSTATYRYCIPSWTTFDCFEADVRCKAHNCEYYGWLWIIIIGSTGWVIVAIDCTSKIVHIIRSLLILCTKQLTFDDLAYMIALCAQLWHTAQLNQYSWHTPYYTMRVCMYDTKWQSITV